MDLYVQMGHGMQSLALELLESGGPETFILSPLNSQENRLIQFANKANKKGAKLLMDPQLYCPRKHQKNLCNYSYWPQGETTNLESGNCDRVINSLIALNEKLQTSAVILPSFLQKKVDARWNAVQKLLLESALKNAHRKTLFHTIALTSEVLLDEMQVQAILGFVSDWDVTGVYIVCEHPGKYYLVNQPLWLSNLLDLVSGIKRHGKKVIVGYASHQMLCLSLSKCDAIASGNFLNVRWFQPEHFETLESDEISRRAVWYYCPQALSEFKVPFLDIAKRMNLLDRLAPSETMINPYCEMLFGTALPTATGYNEKNAHRHYLYSLHKQCLNAVRESYAETKAAQLLSLETADHILAGLRERGIRGQDRDFSEVSDVNRAAIAAHDIAYGFPLSHEWSSL